MNLGEGDTPLVKPSCRGWATFPMAASLGSCCWSMLPTGIRVSSFILPLCCPSKPTSDHLLLGSPFRLPFSGGGCCCKSLLSECWSVLGKAASLAVVVVMHPGAGCVCRRYGHASSLALPGLVSLSYDSLLKIGNLATHSLALSIIIAMHCCHFVLLLLQYCSPGKVGAEFTILSFIFQQLRIASHSKAL